MILNGSDGNRGMPTFPTIVGQVRFNVPGARCIGDNNAAIELHQGLPTKSSCVPGGMRGCTPGSAAIRGGTHLHQAEVTEVVPLDITITIEFAGRSVIADN